MSCGSTAESSGWIFRIWWDQISLGLDLQRSAEILDKARCGRVLYSMISIGFYKLSFSSCRQGLKAEKNKPVRIRNDRATPDIGLAVRVFANGPGDLGSIPGRVIPKTKKMVLDASLLNTQHYKVWIKGKVE